MFRPTRRPSPGLTSASYSRLTYSVELVFWLLCTIPLCCTQNGNASTQDGVVCVRGFMTNFTIFVLSCGSLYNKKVIIKCGYLLTVSDGWINYIMSEEGFIITPQIEITFGRCVNWKLLVTSHFHTSEGFNSSTVWQFHAASFFTLVNIG